MATPRQTSLLVAEDWTKIYRTFKEADFQSYDFETLRKTMIEYLRLYYPEDFNDFIESSEFVSLIDLIAFLGQSLSFRADLNARENFIDTAERRDSILKLARLINYNPKRNNTASGLLKITGVKTTEAVFDSDGISLNGVTINWNDRTNGNWQEQFVTVLNAALVDSQRVGRPGNSAVIANIKTDEYQISTAGSDSPVYGFTSVVDNLNLDFQVVGATSVNDVKLYEPDPRPGGNFSILFRNDRRGNNSPNTGYFMHFKQGTLSSRSLSFIESIPNRTVNIDVQGINNTDVWLYELDANGNPSDLWQPVPTVAGSNIAYNTLSSSNRKIYQINTLENDQISLVFGDGVFAEIPVGTFILFYRTSAGLNYKISPSEMTSVNIDVRYISRSGKQEQLRLSGKLLYTVTNATARETADEIRQRAPQQYYTQNRMVTGEDYNLFPFARFGNIVKVKAVNRTSSGISRYLDVVDSTGKYSSTNIFSDDGWFYREESLGTYTFTFNNTNDIVRSLRGTLSDVLRSKPQLNFYYEHFGRYTPESPVYWYFASKSTNKTTGYFVDDDPIENADEDLGKLQVGRFVTDTLRFIRPGALLKIEAPSGKYFDSNNNLRVGTKSRPGDRLYFYASVVTVLDDGTNQGKGILDDGRGPVTLNEIVPMGALVSEIIPAFATGIDSDLELAIVNNISFYRDFGLRYNQELETYEIISSENLDKTGEFDLDTAGDTSGTGSDSSWLVYFETDGQLYAVRHRKLDFVFESKKQTRFYFDESTRVYDSKTASVVTDNIRILRINSKPDQNEPMEYDYDLQIYDVFVEPDGYQQTNKIKVSYPDFDLDGIPDDVDVFSAVIDPDTNPSQKFVYFKQLVDSYGYVYNEPVEYGIINDSFATLAEVAANRNFFNVGQLFFATADLEFYQLVTTENSTGTVVVSLPGYSYRTGRGQLYFQYRHNSPNNRRIDPSPNNIIDLYVLTKNYDNEFRSWIQDSSGKVARPLAPTSNELSLEFSSIEQYKPVSDALLFNSAKFKVLFGEKADEQLRAKFKVVKGTLATVSDSEIKSRMIEAINLYFALGNWEFGDTFYFSDLSTYLHTSLAGAISSVVLVPVNSQQVFGSLYQVNSGPDEIFISAATVDDIEVIPALTLTQLNI
jgi:hypothetical protein